MDVAILGLSAIVSGLATLLFVPWLIRSLRGTTVVGRDLNKPNRPLVPEMGGVAVILGFYVGVTALMLFPFDLVPGQVYFSALSASLGAGVVGLMDDMFHLRKRSKAILPFFLALPLGSVMWASGNRTLLGTDVGLLMLLIVPFGVTSAANAVNMLEGFNGLGAGLGVIMSSAMIVLLALVGSEEGLFVLFPLLGALVSFLWFNRYPAQVFPGDSMTLFTGAALACAAIISSPSIKTYSALLFTPMILEFVLKLKGRFQAENYGELRPDGRLAWKGPIESLAHALMRWRPLREWHVVTAIWGIEIAVCLAVISLVVAGL